MAGYNFAQNIIGLKNSGGGGGGDSKHHYSTEEQIVGTWLDGSPIYEKTYTGVLPTIIDGTFSNILIDTTTENINLVVDYDIFVIQIINNNKLTVKTPYLTNGGQQLKAFYDGNQKVINVSSNASAYSECTLYATIRYLKNEEIGG